MVAKVLAFVSIKGGVGKTTLALETASSLVKHFDKKVLLVDANFSAPNIGMYLDLTNEKNSLYLHDALLGVGLHNAIYEAHGVDVVPAAFNYGHEVDVFKLKRVLQKMRNRYDFIILDSAPNYDELKPVVAAADRIFVVSSPDEVTLKTSLKAVKAAKEQKTPVEGLVVNRIRSPRHEMNLNEIEETSGVPVLAKIRDDKNLAVAAFNKKPMTVHDEFNSVAKEVKKLSSAICGEPENPGFLRKFFPFKNLFPKEQINREIFRRGFYS